MLVDIILWMPSIIRKGFQWYRLLERARVTGMLLMMSFNHLTLLFTVSSNKVRPKHLSVCFAGGVMDDTNDVVAWRASDRWESSHLSQDFCPLPIVI